MSLRLVRLTQKVVKSQARIKLTPIILTRDLEKIPTSIMTGDLLVSARDTFVIIAYNRKPKYATHS